MEERSWISQIVLTDKWTSLHRRILILESYSYLLDLPRASRWRSAPSQGPGSLQTQPNSFKDHIDINIMVSLPREPFTLHGCCQCTAIRYTISFPNFDERPVLNPQHPPEQPDVKIPLICFDYCSDCRSASGVPVQSWNVCPKKFIIFPLLHRWNDSSGSFAPVSQPNGARIDITGNQLVHPCEMTKQTYLAYFSSSKSVWQRFVPDVD